MTELRKRIQDMVELATDEGASAVASTAICLMVRDYVAAERAKLVAKLLDLASTWERDAKYGQTTDPASELREVIRGG